MPSPRLPGSCVDRAVNGRGMRLDRLLFNLRFAKSRTLAQRWIAEGHIRRNGERVLRQDLGVTPGDVLTLPLRGRVLVPKGVTGHNSSTGGSDINGVRTKTTTDTFGLTGGVSLAATVVQKPGGKEAKPFGPFQAADRKAGGTAGKITDFAGTDVNGRTYTNETKDKLWQRHALFQGPDGPTVLQVDAADRPIVPPSRPDLAVPAIAVPQVMNGGGFGITGFNYYDSALMEGRTDPRAKRRYVLSPAWIAGYGQH